MKISKIKPNESNPRVIKDAKFKQLCESIQKFPKMLQLRPIIVDENYVIQGGNMRYRALIELGYKDIPNDWVKQVADLTEEEKKEFIIKDNIGYGEWDWDVLANEWETENLIEWGLDIPKFEQIGDIEAKGRMAATLDEKMDTYLNATIKQIVLYYENDEYEKVIEKLNEAAKKYDLEDNSSVVKHMLYQNV